MNDKEQKKGENTDGGSRQVEQIFSGDNLPTILNEIILAIDTLAWRINCDKQDLEIRKLRTKTLIGIRKKIDKVLSR